MRNFWNVFNYELIRNITRKGYLFSTLGIPALAIIAFIGYPIFQSFQSPDEDTETTNPIAELALDSLEVAGYVDNSGVFAQPARRFDDVLVAYPDEAAARTALEAGDIDAFLVFPSDYLETGDAVLHIPNLSISLLGDGQSLAEQLAYSTFASGLDELTLRRLSNPASYTDFDLSVNADDTEGATAASQDGQFFFVYVFAMVFFLGIFLTNTYLMQTVIEERENRMVEILISTVRPVQLLGGKILAMAVLGIVQLVLWVIIAATLFTFAGDMSAYTGILESLNIQLRPDLLPLMIVYFVLMYLLYAAIFGTIGAVSGSSQEGSQYAGFLVIPVMIPFYFFPIIQTDPNGTISTIFTLIPVTSPITTMVRMVVTDVPFWQIALSVGLLAVLAVGAMWMAGRIFRVQTLLSGTKVKMTDIPRLIFAES